MSESSRLNDIFRNMKRRCYGTYSDHYKSYGARGITLCDEWNNREKIGYATKGWLAFKEWALNNGYDDNLTIDRIDVNKGYSPENCRWISLSKQYFNTTRSHKITYKGKTQTLTEWADELGISRCALRQRICRGWTVEKAFTTK